MGNNWNSIFNGYHLEHLCGLRKSRSERQKLEKVANFHGS
jgi:hypothetical protein